MPLFADLSFPLLSNIMKLRLVFLAVYLYCHCTRTPFRFCGRAEPERCGYRACLHYLFPICFFSACGQSRCGGGYNGMELYRGTCVQYARPCRCGQNGRPCCKRNDGLVNVKFSISVDFVV